MLLFCLSLIISVGEAYDNEVVHQIINEKAANQSSNLLSKLLMLGFNNGLDNIVHGKKIYRWFHEGARLEDETICRSRNHFHDPLKLWDRAGLNNPALNSGCLLLGLESLSVDSSLIWAQKQSVNPWYDNLWSWPKARQSYYKALTFGDKDLQEQFFAETFRSLGQVMHLLADSSVPAHVRNDVHVFPLTAPGIGIGAGSQTYESWARQNYGKLSYTGVTIDNYSLNQSVPNASAPAAISALWDQDKYDGSGIGQTMGTNIGLTEYANANFFSEDTIFRDYPHPAYSDTNYFTAFNQPEIVDAEDGKLDNRVYIKKTVGDADARLASFSYISYDLIKKGYHDFSPFVLDDNVYNDYAALLIPRAVGYSAVLLNYFFRGDIDMIDDVTTGAGYVIANNTEEDMSGDFELWYDNTSNQRKKVWSRTYSIGKKSSGHNKSTSINFIAPADAKEPNKYMLVFRGKLGAEEDAVVGKSIKLAEKTYLFLVRYDDLAYSLSTSVFQMRIEDNKYRLVPMPQTFSIPIQKTDPASHNYIVQSKDNNTSHSFSYPGRFWLNAYRGYVTCSYSNGILQYGVAEPSGYYRNEYQCHYGTNDISMPLDFWWQSARDGNYSLLAFGRHNYTRDGSGNLAKVNESVWKDMTGGCAMNYLYRYKTDIGSAFVNGMLVATDHSGAGSSRYVDGQGWIACDGPIVTNSIVAMLGNGKAIVGKTERSSNYWMPDKITTERFDFNYDKENYSYSGQWYYSLSHAEGVLVVPVKQQEHVSGLNRYSLEIGGSVIDTLEAKRITRDDYIGSSSNEHVVTTLVTSHEVDAPGQTKPITVTPKTISITVHSSQSIIDGGFTVHDYDNINGDQAFAVIYSKNTFSSANENISHVTYDLTASSMADEAVRLTNENWTVLSSTSSSTNETTYMLALKITNGTIKKIPLFRLDPETQRANFLSIQMNDTTVVYTYVIQSKENSEYMFEKRLLGVVNVSDPALPVGYRQEFEINAGEFSLPTYDYTQGAAIGIHKVK